jgi:hypothetical protein
MNYDATLAKHIVTLLEEDIFIVDVGCSGGIHKSLRQLEPRLAGVGFDPLVAEVNRLNAAETNGRLRYIDAFIVSDRIYPDKDRGMANWFARSSAVAAHEPDMDVVGQLIGVKK